MSDTVMPTVRTADTGASGPSSARGALGSANSSAATSRPAGARQLRTGHLRRARDRAARAEALEQVIADTERVGGDGQRRVHRGARAEEAAIDHVEVVDVVGPAVDIERRRRRIVAEPDGAVLMGDASQ